VIRSKGSSREIPIKTVKIKGIYKNPWLSLEEHQVITPDNKKGVYGVLDYGDGVSVLATDADDIFLIKEYKYAIKKFSFLLPSGSVNKNETPLKSAKKELLKEAGLKAGNWALLGITHPFPTNITTTVYLYLARDVKQIQKPEAGVSLYKFSISKVKRMIDQNKITHSGSLVCLLRYFYGKK
jgi:ADP-ribose pyrophosphatase YjhB (NUDIX family)